jgi:hypothetical protein
MDVSGAVTAIDLVVGAARRGPATRLRRDARPGMTSARSP